MNKKANMPTSILLNMTIPAYALRI